MPPFDESAFAQTAAQPDATPELSPYTQTPGVAPVSTTAPALSPTGQTTFNNAITYGLPLLGVGLADTIGQSLGVLHNNTVPDFLKALTGDGENSIGDFYARNQQPLRTGGEIAGMLLPGLGAMKALKTVKMAREAGQFGEALVSSDTWSGKAMDILLGNSADLTAKETAIQNATYDAKAAQAAYAGRTIDSPAVNAAKRSYYAARAIDAVRTTAAFEFGNRVAFNSSSTFYPADYTLTDQLLWSGAGLAGGVGLDLVAAKYAVRNLVQSAVNGFTRQAQEYGTVEPSVAQLESAKDLDKTIFRPNQRGLGITQVASYSQDLDRMAQATQNSQFKTNIYQDQVINKGTQVKQIGLMGYDTHAFLPRTSLNDDQIGVVQKALKGDPTALLYATKLANVPEDGEDFYQAIAKQTAVAKNDLNAAHALFELNPTTENFQKVQDTNRVFAPLQNASNEVHYVIENDGRYTVYKNRADNWLDTHSFGDIKRKTYVEPDPNNPIGPGTKNSKLLLKGQNNDLVVHDNFRMEIPAGATPMDFSALYAASSKLIQDWKPVEGQQFVLTPKVNWRTLEGTVALAEAKPAAQSAIRLGDGFSSLDDVRFNVLNQKFQDFQKLMPDTAQEPLVTAPGSLLNKIGAKYTPAQVIQRLNLPEPTLAQPSPLYEMFAHAKLQGMTDLNDMFPVTSNSITPANYSQMDLLQAHLRETAGIADPKTKLPIQGVLLNQTDAKPVFVASTGAPLMKRADAMIGGMVQAERDIQLQRMSQIDPVKAPLVTGVIGKIVTQGPEGGDLSGAANTARAVQTLQDGVLSGTGQVVYQDRINEQFPTLKALQLIAQDTDTFTRQHVANLSATQLSPKLASILQTKNRADLLDFNRIEQSYRHGWEIKGFIKNPNGDGYVAELTADDESRINGALKNQHFSNEDDEISLMPDMSVTALKGGYRPLIVSKGAVDVAAAISDLSRQSGVEYNQLQYALGKNPVKIRDFHLPTPELSRDGTWFIRNDSGKVIATYVGSNAKANQARAIEAADALNKAGINGSTQNVAVPLETVQRDHTLDDDFFNVIDYSDQLAKNGVGIKGGLSHVEVDTTDTTLKSMVYSLQRQYLNLGIRSRAAVFEPELNYARQAAQAAGGVSRQNLGNVNIFDRYVSTMFSQSPVQGKGGLQNLYTMASGALDKSLSWLNGHYSELVGSAGTSIQAKAMRTVLRKSSSEEEFNQFAKTLPNWNPFNDVAKWQESTFREVPQWNTKDITNRLTQVSTTLALRFLDAGMSVVHFGNMATNLPSVVMALRRLPDEPYEQWINRTAAWSNRVTPNISTFSALKAVSKVAKGYWNGDYTEVLSRAAKLGYFNPEYASLTKLLTAPPSNKTKQYWNTFLSASTYLADHSEIMARKLSWIMGYGIGKELRGFKNENDAYIFANNFVNDVEGNYSVNNKPAMFTGTIGQPLGAFQTYMTNFYRRMYGYVETQNKAALIAQYAAQATVFGARTVPGFNLWNKTFQTNSNGTDDFITRIEKRFQPGVGELILNGSLDNIPKIFGAGDGFSWHTRGSADYTELPATIADINRAPPIQFLGEVVKGISQTADNVFKNGGFSLEQQEQILARMSTNRFAKNIMEMAANVKTDDRGAVIQMGTRDAIHVAASLLGTQTASVTNMTEANARERTVQLAQEDARETLNMKTRALFQGGEFNIDKLQAITSEYLKNGGNPAYLGQWLRNQMTSSMTPKAYATLQELGRSGKLLEFEDMLATLQQNQGSDPIKQGNK